jgi:elongation factor Ts
MEITASAVNELRLKTGAGMMDCKKALTEAEGDFEKAIEVLRKKGQKVSEMRAGRETNEGYVSMSVNADKTFAATVALGCETDFVGKNEDFVAFAKACSAAALEAKPGNRDNLLKLEVNGLPVSQHLADLTGKIGEKIDVAEYEEITGENIVTYLHSNNKIGVLVAFNQPASEELDAMGRDIAMQIAAMKPVALDETGVPQHIKDQEMEIARDKARQEGKPDNMIDRIAEGTLKKYYQENTLLAQAFVKDSKKTITDILRDLNKDLKILSFKRVALNK